MGHAVEQDNEIVPAKQLSERIEQIESIVTDCSLSTLSELGTFERSFKLARGMRQLRDLISPGMLKDVMALQGSSLGFRTDKDDKGGYPPEIVKEVLIEATIRGYKPIGNEFNIISGRFYATKEGTAARLRDFDGLTDLRKKFGVPKLEGGGAIVKASATWKLDGKPDGIGEYEIPVKVNQGSGADAILGKAERKLNAKILGQLTGSEQPEGDVDDPPLDGMKTVNAEAQTAENGEAEKPKSRADGLSQRLAKKESEPEPSDAADPDDALGDSIERVNALIEQMSEELYKGAGLDALRQIREGEDNLAGLDFEQLAEVERQLREVFDEKKAAKAKRGKKPAEKAAGNGQQADLM